MPSINDMNRKYGRIADRNFRELGVNPPSLEDLFNAYKTIEENKKKKESDDFSLDLESYTSSETKKPKVSKKDYNEERDGFLGFLDSTLGRMSKSFNDVIFPGVVDKQYDVQKSRGSDSPVLKESTSKADNLMEKGFDFLGTTSGYGAGALPALKATKAVGLGAKLTNGMTKSQRALQRAKEGASVGAMFEIPYAGYQEFMNPEQDNLGDHLWDIGAGTVGGAVLDPLIGLGLDKLFKPKNVTMNGEEISPTNNTQRQEETLLLEGQVKSDDYEVDVLELPEPSNYSINRNRNLYDPKQPSQQDTLGLPEPKFQPGKEDLEQLLGILDTKQKDFVSSRMKGINESSRSWADARQEWESVKNLQNEYKRIRDEFEGFSIPKENMADWYEKLPKAFYKKNSGTDIYKAADNLGFENVDEFVSYLQTLKQANDTRLMDISPDTPEITPKQYVDLEKKAHDDFVSSDDYKGQKALIDEITQRIEEDLQLNKPGRPMEFKQERFQRVKPVVGQSKPLNSTRVEGNYRTTPTNSGVRVDPIIDQLNGKTPLGLFSKDANVNSRPFVGGIDTYGQMSKVKDNKESVIGKVWNTFQREASDERVYAKKIENELEGKNRFRNKGPLFQKLTNMNGASGATEYKLNNELLPVLDNLRAKGKSVGGAFEYRIAKNLKQIKQSNPDYVLPRGLNEQDINNVLAQYSNDPDIKEFNDEITKYFNSLLDIAVQKGELSPEMRKAMQQARPDYFPLFRIKDLESTDAFEKAYNDVFGFTSGGRRDPYKRLQEGSEEPIADPIESLVKYTENVMYSTFRNDALQELDRLANLDTEGKWVRREPKGKTDNEISFKVNGEKQTYYVSKDFSEALEIANDVGANIGAISKFAQALGRAQRLAVTGNPAFVVFRSLIRDIPQSWNSSRAGMNLTDIIRASIDLFVPSKVNKKMLEDFYMNGAGMNTVWANDSKQFSKFRNMAYKGEMPGKLTTWETSEQKFVSNFSRLVDAYRERFVDATEQIPKLAEFRASKRKGKDNTEAAFNARTILDYNKSGRSTKKINKYSAFVNTTIRGRDKFVDTLVERPLQTMTKALLSAGSVSALAYYAKNNWSSEQQRSFIDEAPDWLRDTYWLFPAPWDETEVLRIPKPFESAALISTPLESFFRHMEGNRVPVDGEVRDWLKDNILVDPTLTPITPFIEASLNKDSFTNRPIVNEDKKPLDQKDVYTSGIAKGIAGGLNQVGLSPLASPKKIDHIIEGLFPVTGQNVTQSLDRRLSDLGITEKPNYPEGTYKNPVENFLTAGPLRQDTEGRTSANIGKFYEADNKLREIRKKSPEVFEENKDLYSIINKAIKRSNDISSKINKIEESNELTPKEKREALNPLVDERNRLIRYFEEKGVYDYIDELYDNF